LRRFDDDLFPFQKFHDRVGCHDVELLVAARYLPLKLFPILSQAGDRDEKTGELRILESLCTHLAVKSGEVGRAKVFRVCFALGRSLLLGQMVDSDDVQFDAARRDVKVREGGHFISVLAQEQRDELLEQVTALVVLLAIGFSINQNQNDRPGDGDIGCQFRTSWVVGFHEKTLSS
jgi:hypothetical protein